MDEIGEKTKDFFLWEKTDTIDIDIPIVDDKKIDRFIRQLNNEIANGFSLEMFKDKIKRHINANYR